MVRALGHSYSTGVEGRLATSAVETESERCGTGRRTDHYSVQAEIALGTGSVSFLGNSIPP